MKVYDVSALTDKQLYSEYSRLKGNCKTNYDLKLFTEIKSELSFRANCNF